MIDLLYLNLVGTVYTCMFMLHQRPQHIQLFVQVAKERQITDLLHGNVVKFRFALPRLDPDSFREAGKLANFIKLRGEQS